VVGVLSNRTVLLSLMDDCIIADHSSWRKRKSLVAPLASW
jgi:hypothetical protein